MPLPIPIPLWATGCACFRRNIRFCLHLTGSPSIQINDVRHAPRGLGSFDSIRLQYLPGPTAPDTAILHLAYNIGSGKRDTTITVIGTVMNPLPPPAICPQRYKAFFSKSCGGSDTDLRIGVTGCPLANGTLDSVWLTGLAHDPDQRSAFRSSIARDQMTA